MQPWDLDQNHRQMNLNFNVVCLNNVFHIAKINIFLFKPEKKNSRKRNILVSFLHFIDQTEPVRMKNFWYQYMICCFLLMP